LAIQSLIVELRQNSSSPLDSAILSGFAVGQGMIIGQIPGAATTLVVEISKRTVRTYNVGDSGACVIGSRGKTNYKRFAIRRQVTRLLLVY
jgi:hypothetical protein